MFLKQFPEGTSAVTISDRTGRPLFNSNASPGTPLPARVNREAGEHVFKTGELVHPTSSSARCRGRRIVAVSIPVTRGEIVYEL